MIDTVILAMWDLLDSGEFSAVVCWLTSRDRVMVSTIDGMVDQFRIQDQIAYITPFFRGADAEEGNDHWCAVSTAACARMRVEVSWCEFDTWDKRRHLIDQT